MADLTEIAAGPAHLALAPSLGGGIARLDVRGLPLLRPFAGDSGDPFSLASNILAPFSNRISGGGFEWNGVRYPIEPNFAAEPLPIHGDGFQKPWTAEAGDAGAVLRLAGGSVGPWRYDAAQEFHLSAEALRVTLTVKNTADRPLPFGCGFHPWFPRTAETRLSFAAAAVWTADARRLPAEELQLSQAPERDFAKARSLPETLIDNAYTGWSGPARVIQGPGAVSCRIRASENLDTALVYSPGRNADFFCFEPVSHPVDAFHLPGRPGLCELAPQESMQGFMEIAWDEGGPDFTEPPQRKGQAL